MRALPRMASATAVVAPDQAEPADDFSAAPESTISALSAPTSVQVFGPDMPVPASDLPSGAALLVVANEVSGSTTVYEVEPTRRK